MGSSTISFFGLEPRVVRWASLLLLVLGIGYVIHGSYRMFTDSQDYRMHWIEERYVFRGKNPADIFARIQAEKHHLPIPNTGRDASIDPDLGPADGTYPLWAYFTATVFTWPPTFDSGRFYNGILNLLALALLGVWFYRLGEREVAGGGLLFVASYLAVNSVSTTLVVGQYGLQVLAAIFGVYLLAEKKRWLWSGICLGVAMIKLSITAPFALPFMVKGRWALLFIAGGYLVVGTLLIWPLIRTSPIEIFQQMTVTAEHYEANGYSLNNLFEKAGMQPQPAMKLAAVATLGLTMLIMYGWRTSSLLTHFAIAAVASRAWCYHRQYDNLVLVFLLLALGVTAWRSQSRTVAAFFLFVGFSLWMPGRLTDIPIWDNIQWFAWVTGLTVLLYGEKMDLSIADKKFGVPQAGAIPL